MTAAIYQTAKWCDATLQVAAFVLGFVFKIAFDIPAVYAFVGAAQLLSWLGWLIATPRATTKGGRGRYTSVLIIAAVLVALAYIGVLVSGDDFFIVPLLFGALYITPFIAFAYFATTVTEAWRRMPTDQPAG